MGKRRKRTYLEETQQVQQQETAESILQWETAIYARLSVENSKKDDGGASIEEQVAICREYVEEHPYLHLAGIYVDNGWTGTNTNRPEFQKMIAEVKEGRIKAIVLKDFSRFSRDYIEAGNLLENVFPFFGVRFISVSDHYDSFETDGSASSLLIPLKNMINAFYSKDISRKVSTAVHTKQMAGEHIPSAIPYGYRKSTTQAYRFEPDPETRDVVTRIFKMAFEGTGYSETARILNDEGISSPGKLRYLRGVSKDPKYVNALWTPQCVKQILMNPTYTGDLVFGRMPTALYLGKPDYHYEYDETKWRVLKDMHEPLVDRETFEVIKERRNQNIREYREKLKKTKTLREKNQPMFLGFLYCGDCGTKMRFHRHTYNGRTHCHYDCGAWHQGRCDKGTHGINEDVIKNVVWNVLQTQLSLCCDLEKVSAAIKGGSETGKQAEYRTEIQSLTTKIRQRQGKRERLYEDFTDGILTPEEYMHMKQRFDQEYQELNRQLNALQIMQAKLNKALSSENAWMRHIRMVEQKKALDKELLDALVDKILVYQESEKDRRVEVVLKYAEDYQTIAEAYEELRVGGNVQ